MGTHKRKPRSDNDRSIALLAAKNKKDASAPGDNVISADNSAALDIEQPLFDAKKELLNIALSNFHKSVKTFNIELEIIKKRVTHALQMINDQINDKVNGWSASDRTLYGMILSGSLPLMNNERLIIYVANSFVKGETDRIAAGGTPLTMITKAEIIGRLLSLNAKKIAREAKKKLVADATKVMVERRKVVNPLIVNIWKDIENGGQKLAVPARRLFEISWGVVFKSVKNFGFLNVKCININDNSVARGINLRLGAIDGKAGAKAITDEYGVALLKSRNFKPTFINAENLNYEIVSQQVTLAENETQVIVLYLKFKEII